MRELSDQLIVVEREVYLGRFQDLLFGWLGKYWNKTTYLFQYSYNNNDNYYLDKYKLTLATGERSNYFY